MELQAVQDKELVVWFGFGVYVLLIEHSLDYVLSLYC